MDVLLLKSERYLINRFLIERFYDVIRFDIGKHRKLIFQVLVYGFTRPTYEDAWMHTEFSELNYRMLDCFGFHFS